MKLYKRKIFSNIKGLIEKERSLILEGSHRVGKTSVLFYLEDWLSNQGKKAIYYNLNYPDVLDKLSKGAKRLMADLTAQGYGGKEVYLLVDDLQRLDEPKAFFKSLVNLGKKVYFIGTTAVRIPKVKSIKRIEVMPLNFKEFLEFKINGGSKKGIDYKELYREYVVYGGYPEVVLEPVVEKKKQLLWEIVDIYLRKDLGDRGKVKDTSKFYKLLKVIAGQTDQMLDMMALCRESDISFPTLTKYLAVLEQSFLVEKVKPYSHRPATEISRRPKLFFLDSGLQSILWLGQFSSTLLEPVFKTSVFGELVNKVGRGSIRFWRSKSGAEVDFIVQKGRGRILAVDTVVNFQRLNQKHIGSFKRKYKLGLWRVIGLEGDKLKRYGYYPWEI